MLLLRIELLSENLGNMVEGDITVEIDTLPVNVVFKKGEGRKTLVPTRR